MQAGGVNIGKPNLTGKWSYALRIYQDSEISTFATGNLKGRPTYFRLKCVSTKAIGFTWIAHGRYGFPKKPKAPLKKWFHIVYVGDEKGTHLYIDGIAVDSRGGNLGAQMSSVGVGVGSAFDDLMIWNRALSADEVTQVYTLSGGK